MKGTTLGMRSFGLRLSQALRGGEEEVVEDGADRNAPRQLERLVRGLEAQSASWLWETDRQGRLTYLSEKIATQLGLGADAVPGVALTDLFEIAAAEQAERTIKFHLNARTPFSECPIRRCGSGSDQRWSISGRPWSDGQGQYRGFVGIGYDLSEKRRSDTEIVRLAHFDSLTGLANRASIHASLEHALARMSTGYRPIALFLVDLDRFKAVNDTMGHPAGDELLRQVAERLTRAVGDRGLVGRLGGDEFQILLPGESGRDRLAALAQEIIGSVSQPYQLASGRATIGCSIGIVVAPEHGERLEALIRNADLALYAAKGGGRGRHHFYQPEMLAEARTRKRLEDDLRGALGAGQLWLAYQPVVSTQAGVIVGYEALLRWNHPTRGPISPAEFIPVAEDAGLIDPIGEWVMRTACRAAARWPQPVRVAVNVSPVQFAKPTLPGIVTEALAESGLQPGRLELEITESVFLDGSNSTDAMFQSLKRLGVRLALDDFGTGYSSLGYLRTAPFDKIKIDQSFVRGAKVAGSRNAAIVKAIVTLADTLEMETTAEGVEMQDEIQLMRSLGCSHIQGYVYSRPVPEAEVAGQLAAGGAIAPVGLTVSRAPRTSMLRSAIVRLRGRDVPGRIRNASATGLMIELPGSDLAAGEEVGVEHGGAMRRAQVRWARDGRAGLRLLEE